MFTRYAVYVVPDGVWGDFGASWLGWDSRTGIALAQTVAAQKALTERPRKYGFHGTLKPPFRLAEGARVDDLADATQRLCATFTPLTLGSVQLAQLGKFFAMIAPDDHAALRQIADPVVQELEPFRAPLTEEDLKRRRRSHLTDRQEALLVQYGYPHVMDAFKFHMTLTGPTGDGDTVRPMLETALEPVLTTPCDLDSLCLLGEAQDGRFHVLERFAFGG